MSIIDFLWCSAGSIFVSFFDFQQPNSTLIVWKTGWKSDAQNWESRGIFWIHIILFFSLNAFFACILSYCLYKTDLIIDLKCNSALTNFIKIVPSFLQYLFGGAIVYPVIVNFKITEFFTENGKQEIGLSAIYKKFRDYILDTTHDLSNDYIYEYTLQYIQKDSNLTLESLANEIDSKTDLNQRILQEEKDDIKKWVQQLKDDSAINPNNDEKNKQALYTLIKFKRKLPR
jgi:hypothetical protein